MSLQPSASVAADDRETARPLGDRFDLLTLAFILAHGLYWTVMPALASGGFSMDTGEALFWGREWQLGYYKHPPLSAWLAELSVAAFGRSLAAVYLVPQLCVVAAFAAMWWLARRIVSSAGAFLSVAALELFLPFTFEALSYNANVALLPFWAWTIAFAWAALEDDRAWSWARLGVPVGLGFLAKYSILILAAAIALYCLATPGRRWVFLRRGFWLALGVALLIASPHLFWLASVSPQPLIYAAASKGVESVLVALPRAAIFVGHQAVIYLPLLAACLVWARRSGRSLRAAYVGARVPSRAQAERPGRRDEALRFILFVTFAPVVLTVGAALALGQKTPPGWGYTFAVAAGLLAVLALPWLESDLAAGRIPRAALSVIVSCAFALAAVWPLDLRLRAALGSAAPKSAYDGAAHGAIVDGFWARGGAGPLRYQVSHFGGSDDRALGSSTAFFSRHRPSVFHAADPRRSPWIDLVDYRARGGVIVSEAPIPAGYPIAGLCATQVERFERPTRYPGYRPAFFHVGLLLPAAEPRARCP